MIWRAVFFFVVAFASLGTLEAQEDFEFEFGLNPAKNFFVGGGTLTPNFAKVATSPSGNAGLFGDIYGSLNVTYHWWITPFVGLAPSFMITLFGPDNPDGDTTHRYIGFTLPLLFPLLGPIDFRIGPGILYYRIYSDGGVVILDSGTSTATFNIPQGATTSRFLVLDVGFGANLFTNVRLDLGTYVTSLLTTRRSFNMFLTASIGVF